MSEKGHAKNLENLKKARDYAVSWGTGYNPTNPILDLANINAVIASAETVADELQTARTPYRNATAAAQDAFDPLSGLTTRVMNALKVSGVPASVIEDAETYSRKIRGKRQSPAAVDDPSTPDVDESESSHSASQMSRVQRIENLNALNSLLDSQSPYKPNETELQTAALQTVTADLEAKTEAVNQTFTAFSNKLGDRDEIYYTNDNAVVTVGNLFKKYSQAAFGTDSTEYNQVKDLEFKKYKRRS